MSLKLFIRFSCFCDDRNKRVATTENIPCAVVIKPFQAHSIFSMLTLIMKGSNFSDDFNEH